MAATQKKKQQEAPAPQVEGEDFDRMAGRRLQNPKPCQRHASPGGCGGPCPGRRTRGASFSMPPGVLQVKNAVQTGV